MPKKPSVQLFNIQTIINDIFGPHLHKKRQVSLAYAALGLFESESLQATQKLIGHICKPSLNAVYQIVLH